MTVFLVRHADAKSRANWPDDDVHRPLTGKGEAQAAGLADLLHDARVKRILSSPALRCVDTVEPIAAKQGVKVETSDKLFEGADLTRAYEMLRAVAADKGDTILCTHGDLVPELLRLASRDGMTLQDTPRWPKGSTWAIEGDGRSFTKARYSPPAE